MFCITSPQWKKQALPRGGVLGRFWRGDTCFRRNLKGRFVIPSPPEPCVSAFVYSYKE